MRPRGEISLAIEAVLREFGPQTFAEVAKRAQVGRAAASYTLHNMARHARVEVVDRITSPGCNRGQNVFALCVASDHNRSGLDALQAAMRLFTADARPQIESAHNGSTPPMTGKQP